MTALMSLLHVQILSGARNGKRMSFDASPVTFGRDTSCTMLIDNPYASRVHGEIRFENGEWVLVNLSPNGTKINKKDVSKKPQVVKDGDIIYVGDEPVFRVLVPSAGGMETSSPDTPQAPGDATAKPQPMAGRTKLWIGIGIYMFLMMCLMIAFSLFKGDSSGGDKLAAELTFDQIEADIQKMPTVAYPDPQLAAENFLRAQQLFAQRDVGVDRLFQTHRAYQLALVHEGKRAFSGQDQLQFKKVEQQLVEEVARHYKSAYARLRSKEYREAADAFSLLRRMYPDPERLVYRNAEQQEGVALRHIKRRR